MFKSIIRASAFLRKEVFEVLRQPRLVFTLILGPFLILLVFGVGYHNAPRSLRTLFVAPAGSEMAQQIQKVAPNLGQELIFMGITDNQQAALDRLRRAEVDLVVIAPIDPYKTIRDNQQAVFTLYHREIDPVEVDYVAYFGQFYVDEANRQILQSITAQGQADAAKLHNDLQTAKTSANALQSALQSGDSAGVNQHQQELTSNVGAVALAAGATMGLFGNVQSNLGSQGDPNSINSSITDLQQNNTALNSNSDPNAKIQALSKIQKDLDTLDTQLTDFRSITPAIIVSPFRSETKTVAPILPSATDFFAPAVLALLLQHMAVTFAALSIVRERTGGTMELFRISPLSAAEALIGKYISYLIFGSIIAASLILLLIYGLHMPMLGDWSSFILTIAGLLFASLGIGFIISIISQNESQAVQYSMIVLLTSVFFTGLILSLDMLTQGVRVISWLIPATYGTLLLRNIALRGAPPDLVLLGSLFAFGLGWLFIAWLMMRRLISATKD